MAANLTEQQIEQCSTKALLALFYTLDAPSIDEMNGEYAARLLAQPSWLATMIGQAAVTNPLQGWRYKAFRPVDGKTGRGYNVFVQGKREVQRYPMLTMLAASRFDGRPAYHLIYRHYHSLCGTVHMVDEVRRAGEGLYLGIGTYGFTNAQRRIPYPFLLKGPQAVYRGDIGRERKDFRISQREIPALHP